MLGSMLFSRAGVSVSGGRDVFNARIAETSSLFWAVRRKSRPHQDLSHGWGGNSQWRTDFRRDYRVDNKCFYNVDAQHDLSVARPTGPYPDSADYPLSRDERVELLTHRCFVRTARPSDDLWPYDDKLTVAC